MNHDITIIGAGPVGLSLARAFADLGLRVAVVDRQSADELADPPFDGREIALNHASIRLMRELGLQQHIPPTDFSPINAAQIMNGAALPHMRIGSELAGHTQLGVLVPNHQIRKAAWLAMREAMDTTGRITLHTGTQATVLRPHLQQTALQLADGSELTCALLIAADSRFSETRRALGIDTDLHDFGKSMLVCRMQHEADNERAAWQWFGQEQTLALLPIAPHISSAVITLTGENAQRLAALPEPDFNQEIASRYDHRLGDMRLISSRHIYPLVTTWARRFVGTRFALAGDAAVGMHPVTAHGFNLGLASVERLRDMVRIAQRQGCDPGDAALLARYQRLHRHGAWPLYACTRAIVALYTDDAPRARWLRQTALSIGQRLPPLRRAIAAALIDDGPVDVPLWKRAQSGFTPPKVHQQPLSA